MEKSIFLEQANIIIPIVDEYSLEKISSTKNSNQFDVVEVRIDLLMSVPDLKQKISKINTPVLLTCRHPDEGGNEEFRDPIKRQSVIAPFIPYASAIDIEIDQAEPMQKLLTLAKSEGLLIVLSSHNFDTTPDTKHLQDKVNEGYEKEADIVKIATTTNDITDIINLMNLFNLFESHPLSIMGMGRLGMASRLLAAQCGSVLNYAALESTNVSGQWELNDFKKVLGIANKI